MPLPHTPVRVIHFLVNIPGEASARAISLTLKDTITITKLSSSSGHTAYYRLPRRHQRSFATQSMSGQNQDWLCFYRGNQISLESIVLLWENMGKCTHLVTFAVVLETTRSLAVTAFVVASFDVAWTTFANLRMKCMRISVQTCLDGLLSVFFMVQIVETMIAVAIAAEFPVCKAIAISERTKFFKNSIQPAWSVCSNRNLQFQALRFCTVTRLPLSGPICFQRLSAKQNKKHYLYELSVIQIVRNLQTNS